MIFCFCLGKITWLRKSGKNLSNNSASHSTRPITSRSVVGQHHSRVGKSKSRTNVSNGESSENGSSNSSSETSSSTSSSSSSQSSNDETVAVAMNPVVAPTVLCVAENFQSGRSTPCDEQITFKNACTLNLAPLPSHQANDSCAVDLSPNFYLDGDFLTNFFAKNKVYFSFFLIFSFIV